MITFLGLKRDVVENRDNCKRLEMVLQQANSLLQQAADTLGDNEMNMIEDLKQENEDLKNLLQNRTNAPNFINHNGITARV